MEIYEINKYGPVIPAGIPSVASPGDKVGMGARLDPGILELFSNLDQPVILWILCKVTWGCLGFPTLPSQAHSWF